jgi:hypothetical protein
VPCATRPTARRRAGSRVWLLGVALLALVASSPAGAEAASVSLCVSTTAGQAVTSGACGPSGTTVARPASPTDQQTLISLLPYLSYTPSGIDGKPTITVTGANLQIVDGSGSTSTVNGTGNLILGYDETPGTQTGSHDMILGEKNAATSTPRPTAGAPSQAAARTSPAREP